MKSYQDLHAWQKAMNLTVDIYTASRVFPREEKYGLTAQMRRAAVSVPSNIAEAQGRFSRRECQQFLLSARGSALELETQVILASRLGYLKPERAAELLAKTKDVCRVLNGFLAYIRKQPPS